MKQVENKVVIVTGAAGSIGKAVVKLFLDEGAKIMLVDIDEIQLIEMVNEYSNKNIRYCVADVSKSRDVEFYVNETVKLFGQIDVFFNNAGIEGIVKPIVDYPEEIFDKVISVNVKGIWLGNKYVIPNMKEGGSIIITSSVAGLIGFANLSAYVTSKHALVGIMRSAAIEVAPLKIRVNTIHPSPVNNRMMRSIEEGYSSNNANDIKSLFEKVIPLKRYAEPIEIAKLVLFLASDNSRFITGTTLLIDGGMCTI
jgi:NAD(P)-dependent dehydrogenase (short-subunit alcohol dehydrogenase family)